MQSMRSLVAFSLLVATLAGCSAKGSGDESFQVRSTTVAVAGTTRLAVSGKHLAFLASEGTTGAGGTDFNGDGDKMDAIAVAVDMNTHVQDVLDVAALDLAWIGDELYLAVDEALDGHDWNSDADQNDVVLLHWSKADAALTYVDELASSSLPQFSAVGTNLFYTAATTPSGATQSNLYVISSSAPLTKTMIATQDLAAELTVEILARDESLLFLGLDEADNGRDLNNDTDSTDAHVLALLDATGATGVIRNVELAVPSSSGPFRAKKTGTHDWDVGFLVSESAQDSTNFNDPALFDPAWQATQCAGHADSDTSDDVLHFLEFAAWDANPGTHPPRNTGLAAKDKIAIANGFIAAICAESNEGTCDLNQDGDTSDDVVRWTQIVSSPSPILPLNTASNLHALFDCPGGTHGLAELDNAFVAVVSESDDDVDIDGDSATTKNLVGWLLPSNSAHAWDFTPGSSATYAGATWLRETHDRARLTLAFPESVEGVNINLHNPPVAGEDTDTNDSVPTFPDLSGSTLTYPGVAIALSAANAGMLLGKNVGFYRVSEAADSRDWNGDGDETDFVLFRTSLSDSSSGSLGVLNDLTRLAVEFDENGTPSGAAFLADESLQPADYDGDGDTNDYVVRYFRF